MESLARSNKPPDMPVLTPQELKQWESGNLTLTPEELVSAIHLQRTLLDNSVELELVSAV